MAGTWNSANMDAALSASNMRWYSSQYNPYGIELSDFIGSTATLGKTVANADAIYWLNLFRNRCGNKV